MVGPSPLWFREVFMVGQTKVILGVMLPQFHYKIQLYFYSFGGLPTMFVIKQKPV